MGWLVLQHDIHEGVQITREGCAILDVIVRNTSSFGVLIAVCENGISDPDNYIITLDGTKVRDYLTVSVNRAGETWAILNYDAPQEYGVCRYRYHQIQNVAQEKLTKRSKSVR